MFARAEIPIVQLSLQRVLNVGSGMSFHNMRGYGDSRYTAPSEIFDRWLTDAVQAELAAV